MNKGHCQSSKRRQSWLIVAVLVSGLALSPAMAARISAIDSDEGTVRGARTFAYLDSLIAANGCLQASQVAQMDQVFIDLQDWDARSRLHSAAYPVCSPGRVTG